MMRVLVVEDNALLRHHLKVQLQDLGHQVDDAEDAKEADYYLNEHLPDIAIVDLGLPDEDGLSLIRRWRSNEVSLPILVLTARRLAGQSGSPQCRRWTIMSPNRFTSKKWLHACRH